MTCFHKTGDRSRYDFRSARCIGLPCWTPGRFQVRGAASGSSRATGSEKSCCLYRAYHGCPQQPYIDTGYEAELARERKADGWRKA